MPDIKSAWEIAQEKASKLGELSTEEREEQRREKCRLLGEALADKYLMNYDIGIIKDELSKRDPAEKNLFGRATVRRLSKAIHLSYPDSLAEISRAILEIESSSAIKQTMDEIKTLFEEYILAEKKERLEIENSGGEILHQMRISGSAVGNLNIRAKNEWQKKLEQVAGPFDIRLTALKAKLQL